MMNGSTHESINKWAFCAQALIDSVRTTSKLHLQNVNVEIH